MYAADSHSVYLIPQTVKDGRKSWKAMPPADCERGESECVVKLESPAPQPGIWRIRCDKCGAVALVTCAASVSDPSSFALPCRKEE